MIPESIAALPEVVQNAYVDAYEKSNARGNSELTSSKVAWEIVKSKFKPDGDVWVAASDAFTPVEYYSFEAVQGEEFVSRTSDGKLIHTYVLTDVFPDGKGKAPSAELLRKWASDLNSMKPEIDTDHELLNMALETHHGDVELVSNTMKFKKGIAKVMGAVFEAGRLVVRVLFDKRYENHTDRIKGMSFEAACKKSDDGVWRDGRIFGATFALNSNPVNPRAVRLPSNS